MKKIVTFFLTIAIFTNVYAFENIKTEQLLLAYLQNDSELQNLSLAVQKAELSLNRTEIDNGVDVQLSTGTITIKNVNGATNISAKPRATVTIPAAKNLTVQATTDFSNAQNTADFTNTSLSLSVDIFAKNPDARIISLKKAERAVTTAKRKLEKRAVSAEKEFYTQLKSLLSSTNQIIQAETSLYSDKISFEEVKAKGFSENSSTYRLAQMKVLSDEHSIEANTRALLHDYIVFYMNCGYDLELEVNEDFLNLIPADLPAAEPLNIKSFQADLYTETEEAVWAHTINSQERNQTKNFTLAANAGYTLKNAATATDTIDAGLSSTFHGVTLTGGINVPLAGPTQSPAYTFSAAISPNTQKKNMLDKKSDELTEQQELLAIQTAQSNYEAAIVKSMQQLEQIKWETQTNEQNYEMYKKLATDLEAWYKQGFITESEYLSAKTNMQLYNVKKLVNQLEILIYNDDVQQMFVSEAK